MSGSERLSRIREKYLVETAPEEPAKTGRPSVSATYRNVLAKDKFATLEEESLHDVFQRSVQKFASNACLGWRGAGGHYLWETYQEVAEKVAAVASALAYVGLKAHGRVGIYSFNTPEWMIAMQACNRMTLYTIPLYDTFGEKAVEYIVNHSESSVVFVNTKKWSELVASLPQLSTVHAVIYWGSDAITTKEVSALGKKVYSFKEFMDLGKEHPAEPVPPRADDLCTIMYTSGTTGDPKGVMLTHSNVMHCIATQDAMAVQADGMDPPSEDDVFLSWLPLAHIMDRAAEEAVLYTGGRIGYWSGDVELLQDDIQTLRPTVLVAPPRFWDRVYAGAMAKIKSSNFIRQFIFDYAYNSKLSRLQAGAEWDKAAPFLDKIVFSKFAEALGGRLRGCFSGSAPLAPHIEEFLRVAMPRFFVQGYGLTETCAVSFYASSNVWESFGTVGVPSAILEYRIESVPDMHYDALGEEPQGEICIRGACNFKGYYKDPEKTAEVVDSEGWFHTGDIGQIDSSGALRIMDRKKEIFKLSQGEYVVPTKVEAAYKHLPTVEQIFVHGISTESKLVAVVVPARDSFAKAANAAGLYGDFHELLRNPKAKEWLLGELNARGREAGLKGFEQARGLILDEELFSVENNLLTPTLKLKRNQLQAKYKAEIEQMYAELRR